MFSEIKCEYIWFQVIFDISFAIRIGCSCIVSIHVEVHQIGCRVVVKLHTLNSCPKTIFQVCIFIVFRIATFHVVGTPVYFTGNHAPEIEKPVEPDEARAF